MKNRIVLITTLFMVFNLINPTFAKAEVTENVGPTGYDYSIGPIKRFNSQEFNNMKYSNSIRYRNLDFLDNNTIFCNGYYSYYHHSNRHGDTEDAGRIFQSYNLNNGSGNYRHTKDSYYYRDVVGNVVLRNPIKYIIIGSSSNENIYLNDIKSNGENSKRFYTARRSPHSSFRPSESNRFFNLDDNTFLMVSYVGYTIGSINSNNNQYDGKCTFYIFDKDGKIIKKSNTYHYIDDIGQNDISIEYGEDSPEIIHAANEANYYVIYYKTATGIKKKYFDSNMQYIKSMDKKYTLNKSDISNIKVLEYNNFSSDVNRLAIYYKELGQNKLLLLDINLNQIDTYNLGNMDNVDSYVSVGNYVFFDNYINRYGHHTTTYLLDVTTGNFKQVAQSSNTDWRNGSREHTGLGGAVLSPDRKYVYFCINSDRHIYQIPHNTAPKIENFQVEQNPMHIKEKIKLSWAANDPDGDILNYNIQIGNTPGSAEYINHSIRDSSFLLDTSNLKLNWNSSTNRYEKTLYARLIADDGRGKSDTKDIAFLIYNYKPNISISTAATTYSLNQNEPFILQGRAWDINSDRLTITATVGGKTKSTTIYNSPSSQPNDNWTLTWDDLPEGDYQNIEVTVTDPYGASVRSAWTGKIHVKDVLGDIDNKIKKYVQPKVDVDMSFVVSNTDVKISESNRNNILTDSIKNNITHRNIEKMYFIGQDGTTKQYIENQLTDEYSTVEKYQKSDILDYLQRLSSESLKGNILLIGDNIENNMMFEDIEKDYQDISISDKLLENKVLDQEKKKPKEGTLQIKYEHNPNIFDNPVSVHSKGNKDWQHISGIDDLFVIKRAEKNMRGQWIISVKASDTTKNGHFDKESDIDSMKLIIHEKPKAIVEYSEDANYMYLSGRDSYDPDFQYSLPNNGIVKYEWHYLLKDGTWHKWNGEENAVAIPKVVSGQKIIGYSLTVHDCYGAKDSTIEKNIVQPNLKSQLYPEDPRFNITNPGIPASELIKVTNIQTMPYATDTVEFSLYQNGVRRTPIITLRNPGGVLKNEILRATWKDIRSYQIPSTLPDGQYEGRIKGVKGSLVLENKHMIRVHTPIDLKPKMPSLVRTMEVYNISSTTTKYANTVTVKAFKGTPHEREFNLIGTPSGEYKSWNQKYTIPDVPDGEYIFEFTATTPNGNKEVKELRVRVEALQIHATLAPNPALAGDEIIFTVDTKGFVDRIEIDVDPDIIKKDNRIGKYTYPTLRFKVNGSKYEKQDILKYILCVKTDQTLNKQNVRLRPEYTFKVRGYRGKNFKEVTLKLDVRRSVLDLLHPGVKMN